MSLWRRGFGMQDPPSRPRCANCGTPNAADQVFCGRCGNNLRAAPDPAKPPQWQQPYVPPAPGQAHRLLKGMLGVWAIGYAVISCSPMFISGGDSGTSIAAGGIASFIIGATLFGPWIVGLLVLGVLVYVTK